MQDALDNVYGRILDWGAKRIDSGVKYSQYLKEIEEYSAQLGDKRKLSLFLELFVLIDGSSILPEYLENAAKNDEVFHLRTEAAFQQLARVDLLDARKSARMATNLASVSMFLAALFGVLQLVGWDRLSSLVVCLLSYV